MALAAVGLAQSFPISKHRMSVRFDVLVCAVAATVFGLTDLLVRRGILPKPLLLGWGQNPLAMHCSHLFLRGAFLEPPFPWWHVDAPLGQAIVQCIALMAVLDPWARWLVRCKVFISL